MEPIFCIPAAQAEILKKAVRNGDVVGDINTLYNMTSKERREAFSKHVGRDMGSFINTGFERAMLSSQKTALANWVKNTFTPEQKKSGQEKNALTKIAEMDSEGMLTPATSEQFLEDLVADKLGLSITAEEAKAISDKSRRLQELAKQPSQKFGPSIEYWKERKEYENYLDSLTPSSNLKVFTSVISRATMLFSIKSPIVNIESNTVNAITEAMARRMETLTSSGITPRNEEALAYMKYANEVFNKTGFDVTRMISMTDGRKRLGEDIVHSQGKGAIRKLGRFYTDIVFNKLMTAPDVAFAAFHFSDSAHIHATIQARSEGLSGDALKARVKELFIQATNLNPQSPEAAVIRDKARLEAERGTYTDENNYSRTALSLRKVLNDVSKDYRLGDNLMPFVKVPASVVGATLDYSGVTLPFATMVKLTEAVQAKKRGDIKNFKEVIDKNYIRKVVRAGIGITTAFILSNLFDPEDFIGEYPITETERELFRLKKATENSIRIGNKWISLDYFGPLAAPFVGMMYAKKYGEKPQDKLLSYSFGTAIQASRIPGFRQFYDIYTTLENLNPAGNNVEKLKEASFKYMVDFFRSRTLPAIVSDLAKGTDPNIREIDKNDVIGQFLSNIPGIRKRYPEKLDVFGEKVTSEGFWSTVLFGSRIKEVPNDPVIQELSRLSSKGMLPSITDVSKTSERAKALKEQVGNEKYREFYTSYGKRFKLQITNLVQSSSYKNFDDEKRKNAINDIKSDIFESELKRAGYRKPPKK